MLSSADYVKHSIELNLFFARILKEHMIFIAAGLPPKNADLIRQADSYRLQFENLLSDALALSNGVVSPEVIASNELVTPYTLRAEQKTQYYTGMQINTSITEAEKAAFGEPQQGTPSLMEARISNLNKKAMALTESAVQFKKNLYDNVLACRVFSTNYPSMLHHVALEANHYLDMLAMLERREDMNMPKMVVEHEIFWNHIMGEHAEFIRGQLDPSEEALIEKADITAKLFKRLTREAEEAAGEPSQIPEVTEDSFKATRDIRSFKAQATQGLLTCNLRAVTLPLLADHVLREASHYLRHLLEYMKQQK